MAANISATEAAGVSPAIDSFDDDDDDDDDDDSDDEYLYSTQQKQQQQQQQKHLATSDKRQSSGAGGVGGGGGGEDREAIIRRKLLESFYGAAAAADASKQAPTSPARGSGGKLVDDDDDEDEEDEEEDEEEAARRREEEQRQKDAVLAAERANLDSSYFDCRAHTYRHVSSSRMETLLEVDERLASDIRLRDSTMQTLVYENYSKFIHATDAVRSVGRGVDTVSKNGLQSLLTRMDRIVEDSGVIESALQSSREETAEKIRIRRLLGRLDDLLKLPSTLREWIEAGQYRRATQSYATALAVLARAAPGTTSLKATASASAGAKFSSLEAIEEECSDLLVDMVGDLKRKLRHWSGVATISGHRRMLLATGAGGGGGAFLTTQLPEDFDEDEEDMDEEDEDDEDEDDEEKVPEETDPPKLRRRKTELMGPPPHPTTISEIFECAGAVLLFSVPHGEVPPGEDLFTSGLSEVHCKSLALDCCRRHLERLLDDFEDDEELLPTHVLDGILESATLFGVTFQPPPMPRFEESLSPPPTPVDGKQRDEEDQERDGIDERKQQDYAAAVVGMNLEAQDHQLLEMFVSGVFHSFLLRVRKLLMDAVERQQSSSSSLNFLDDSKVDEDDEDDGDKDNDDDGDDEHHRSSFAAGKVDIGRAMQELLQSVRELASGLALPEIGIDADLGASLVDRTMAVMESMVRRRIGLRFLSLRVRVVRECVAPFVREALEHGTETLATTKEEDEGKKQSKDGAGGGDLDEVDDDDDEERVVRIVRLANIAVSDAVQLADDVVQSVMSKGGAMGSASGTDDVADEDGPSKRRPQETAIVDSAMLKLAVERNVRCFALWFAGALEMVAGCEDSRRSHTLEVWESEETHEEEEDRDTEKNTNKAETVVPTEAADLELDENEREGLGAGDESGVRPMTYTSAGGARGMGGTDVSKKTAEKAETLLSNVIYDLWDDASDACLSYVALATSEACRFAERTLPQGMNQSIATSLEGAAKAALKGGILFGTSAATLMASNSRLMNRVTNVDADGALSLRFRTAAARCVMKFALDRGVEASLRAAQAIRMASTATSTSNSTPTESEFDTGLEDIPVAPTEASWRVLEVAKRTSIDCACIYGGERMAEDVDLVLDDFGGGSGSGGGGAGAAGAYALNHARRNNLSSGLQLDVERMFSTEKVQIYPDGSRQVVCSRNFIVAMVLRMAFRAAAEQCRLLTRSLTVLGYRQVQVDVALWRHMVTHYVRDDYFKENDAAVGVGGVAASMDGGNPTAALTSLLNDAVFAAGDSCRTMGAVGVEEYFDAQMGVVMTPRSIVARFFEQEMAKQRQALLQDDMEDEGESGSVLNKFVIGGE